MSRLEISKYLDYKEFRNTKVRSSQTQVAATAAIIVLYYTNHENELKGVVAVVVVSSNIS